MNFLKKWLRWQLQYFASVVVCLVLIVGFGALAGTYWPSYAWGSTAVFTLLIIWLAARMK